MGHLTNYWGLALTLSPNACALSSSRGRQTLINNFMGMTTVATMSQAFAVADLPEVADGTLSGEDQTSSLSPTAPGIQFGLPT